MKSSVPDGDGSPVYTKSVQHTTQVARGSLSANWTFRLTPGVRQCPEHAYIQQSQRYIEEKERALYICVHTCSVHVGRVYTEVHHQFVHKYKIVLFGNAGEPS